MEGNNLTLVFVVVAALSPKVEWFRNGLLVTAGFNRFNFTTKELIGWNNSLATAYEFKLFKESVHVNDSGIYQAQVIFGSFRFSIKNYSVSVWSVISCKLTS